MLLTCLAPVPFRARVDAMAAITRGAIGPAIGYRRRILENLALVRPGMSEAERRDLARACLDNFGRTVMENFFAAEFAEHLAGAALDGAGLETLAEARASGRPVIFAAAHFGNHEAPRHLLNAGGDRVGGLYRPLSNPLMNRFYERTLDALGAPTFAQGRDGTAAFLKYLRGGGWGALYYDVHQPRGTRMTFLGQPADTSTSAARLALKVGAPLVPWFAVRAEDNRSFRCVIEAPVPPGDPVEMTQALHASLEARIAQTPEQWMWIHRRWKAARRPPAS